RGRRSALDHHAPGALHRLRHLRRGVPGESPERRADPARHGGSHPRLVPDDRGVRTRGVAVGIGIERSGEGLGIPARGLARGRRGRLFLSRYSRVSRDIPGLEITSFDIDKLLKERFRKEPLTVGAAWHHGFWRSYFSHAAITHPANDGLREEFSTGWDIV